MKRLTLCLCACACLAPALVWAHQDQAAKEAPAHQELRALKQEVTEAVNQNDLPRLLTHLDKDVVVTWLNGEVSRGPDGVRAYYDRMMKGDQRVVQSVKVDPEVEELTHLYGDTGVAFGHSNDTFVLTDGREFVVPSRWSATLVKKDGKWLIANFHSSANMFDNPILAIAVRKTALWTGIGAGVAGLVLGFIIAWIVRRRRA
jgi:uncharacterized protein (TIGR02246 family)